MKKTGWVSAALLLMLALHGKADSPEKGIDSYGKWEMVKSYRAVTTFVRWIRYTDGTTSRERKGEFMTEGGLDRTVNLLTDASILKQWVSGVSENYRLTTAGESDWLMYTLYDIPWPFHKRDLVSAYSVRKDRLRHRTVIEIRSDPDFVPGTKGVERLVNYNARWTVTEAGVGKVLISFSAQSDTPPLFPRYIQDPVIERMFHNNLVTLRKILSEAASR